MANLSQEKRKRMLEFLQQIRAEHTDDTSIIAINEIESELTSKKYGLVWEEHTEEVDEQIKHNVPVFTEVSDKIITTDENLPYNFLLEGDNLHSLKLLEKTHKGKIDVIYIDPPYNTGNKDFIYSDKMIGLDDGFRHSKWLSFMKTRLDLAKVMKNHGFAEEFYRWGHGIVADLWTTRWQEMKSILLPIPSLEEQQQILDAISVESEKVDALIANVQAQIEKLKAYKQSMITEVVTKGLDPSVPMKDSGVEWIGEIPATWAVMKTGRLFKENNRTPYGGETPLSLSQADGLVATTDMKESSLRTSSYDNWKHVEVGDLVLNRFKAHLGVLFAATLTGIVSFHYGVYEARMTLLPKYYEYLYHSDQYRAILGNASNGMVVGLQNLSNLSFYTTYSLYPPVAEQEKVVAYLDKKCTQIDQLIAIKQKKIDKLNEYKKSLIYEYVTGKREVS